MPETRPESDLWPSEILARIRGEHDELRLMLEGLEHHLADADTTRLRALTVSLLPRIERHIALEDRILGPALLEADAWGDVRNMQLQQHHEKELAELRHTIAQVRSEATPDDDVRQIVTHFIAELRHEMTREDQELLRPDILRDDTINTDFVGS